MYILGHLLKSVKTKIIQFSRLMPAVGCIGAMQAERSVNQYQQALLRFAGV
jgi:hypothetical protein